MIQLSKELSEDDESTFELFVDWLYHQRYEMLPYVDGDEAEGDGRLLEAFQLFVLPDKYKVLKLKSLLIEKIFAHMAVSENGLVLSSIAYAYKHTTQGSGLRKLLADSCAWYIDPERYEDPEVQAFLRRNPDFATDLTVRFARKFKVGKTDNPFKENMPEEYKDKESE